MEILVLGICMAGLIAGTYTDLRTREVPDWVNYSLMFAGFGIAVLQSLIYSDWWVLARSAAGFAAFFLIAVLMYYTGQWGGGDSKMIMGLGALVGLEWPIATVAGFAFLVNFLIYTIVIGAIYGLIWSAALALKNRRAFLEDFIGRLKDPGTTRIKKLLLGFAFIVLGASFFLPADLRFILLLLAMILIMTFYMFVFVKSVEKVCMVKKISPEKLTLGDWVAEDIIVGKKTLASKKDLGIEKDQLTRILKLYKQGKIKEVVVREGVPFVPSFLMAFLLVLFAGSAPIFAFI